MKPKLLHWCVIGWTDAKPALALCTNVRRLEFMFPAGGGRWEAANACGVEEIDSKSQVLAVLGRVEMPSRDRLANIREEMRAPKRP